MLGKDQLTTNRINQSSALPLTVRRAILGVAGSRAPDIINFALNGYSRSDDHPGQVASG